MTRRKWIDVNIQVYMCACLLDWIHIILSSINRYFKYGVIIEFTDKGTYFNLQNGVIQFVDYENKWYSGT